MKLNWQENKINLSKALPLDAPSDWKRWSVVVCADWAPRFGHWQTLEKEPRALYGDLLPIIQKADLAMVNVEGVLADEPLTPIVKDGIILQMPTQVALALSAVPFQLACLANNHIFDCGVAGLTQTQAVLCNHGLESVGAGLSLAEAETPKFFQFGSTRLAVINVAEGEEGRSVNGQAGVAPLDIGRLQKQLSVLRTQVDVLLVVAHAGRENFPMPVPHIQTAYRAIIEAGADLVIGHHPHVAQGVEIYQGKPIVYSLGNFAFLMGSTQKQHLWGYFLKANFYGPHLSEIELWPYHVGEHGLSLLTGKDWTEALQKLANLSDLITDEKRFREIWEAYAARWWAVSGAEELADSVASLTEWSHLLQSMLKAALPNFTSNWFKHRLARALIWRSIHWLERRNQSTMQSRINAESQHVASILRNRFDTVTHRELYLLVLKRIMDGKIGQTEDWANQQLIEWDN